jgi:hypothetical protein
VTSCNRGLIGTVLNRLRTFQLLGSTSREESDESDCGLVGCRKDFGNEVDRAHSKEFTKLLGTSGLHRKGYE